MQRKFDARKPGLIRNRMRRQNFDAGLELHK